MDVEVYYSGQRGGTMPYAALPAFRLFCKQNGFQLKWDPKQKRIDLDSGLKGKVCALFTGSSATETAYEWEVLGKVQRFVSDYGMEVVLAKNNLALAKNTDIAIRFSMKELRQLEKPRLVLYPPESERQRELIRCLQAELKQTGIPCQQKVSKGAKQNSGIVHVQLQIPLHTEVYRRRAYSEKIAFYLASGILEYMQSGLRIQPLAYLPPNILKLFYSSVWPSQPSRVEAWPGTDDKVELLNEVEMLLDRGAVHADERGAKEENAGQTDVVESAEAAAQAGAVEQAEAALQAGAVEQAEAAVQAGTVEQAEAALQEETVEEAEPAVQAGAVEQAEAEKQAGAVEPAEAAKQSETVEQPKATAQANAPVPIVAKPTVQAQGRIAAEVFFDYTLIHSDSAEKPYLLIGTLQVKNTGTEVLYNPIVCLRVTPADSIKMGGQILPPKLVETLAVQGSNGLKGWRYLDDDWFTQAMERGEYWIAPIQPVVIPPQSAEAFQNFQVSFLKQESGKAIVVEGIVLCNDQSVHFSANNRIAVSF
ncbi:hypothetical protein EDM57_22155 [Brevibacillus gelatini]|uniref:Uncharacterized protein n=1 Tax=Brevibacillus gelatini TaxID=1655277 RepID=A0A3M8AML3_9BACL|nr:hypothetical protein [Brevibacillus gelatini]RNB51725.1 hypothetical protein EDM57_22155 [Brevibacillus gelatini]